MNYTMNDTNSACHHALGPIFTSIGLVIMCAIIVLSLLGNVLVCYAVVRFRQLQTSSNCFVCSLAISDMLVSSFVVPFDIVYWVNFPHWPLGGYLCNLWNSFFFLFLTASVFNLLAISADRFVAVIFPLRYQNLIDGRCVKAVISATWLYSIAIGVMVFLMLTPPHIPVYTFDLDPSIHAFLLVGNVLVPFAIMIAIYFKIYLIAREHARRVGTVPSKSTSSTVRDLIGRELRVAKALGIVLATFVLCWLPFEIINVVIIVDGNGTCAIEVADTIACWLAYMQTTVNPVIFAFANADFRRAFRKILGRMYKKQRMSSSLNSSASKRFEEKQEDTVPP